MYPNRFPHDTHKPPSPAASAFGAFNSFFVLPVGVLVYAILLRTVFNPIESETEMIVTKNCTQFNFTCTTLYGCEVAAMGKRTTEFFSRKNESLFLEQGQRMNETICPGLNEALDIAPRAAVNVGDDEIYASFEHEGMGYFGGYKGIVYQVNLTNMHLVNRSNLGDGRLNTGFASGGYGYVGGGGVIVKFDLKTLAKVKSVKVGAINTGFAYNGYGYFGSYGITQVDLTTMEVINKKKIPGAGLYASSLGDGYGLEASFAHSLMVGPTHQVQARIFADTSQNFLEDDLPSDMAARLPAGTNLNDVVPTRHTFLGAGLSFARGIPGEEYPLVASPRYQLNIDTGYVLPDNEFGISANFAIGSRVFGSDELSLNFGVDEFGESASAGELYERFSLTPQAIADAILTHRSATL